MAQKTRDKGAGKRKYGRNKIKCERYRKAHRRYQNKIRRVLKCNGPAAAQAYRDRV
jgi:hypothetical protein